MAGTRKTQELTDVEESQTNNDANAVEYLKTIIKEVTHQHFKNPKRFEGLDIKKRKILKKDQKNFLKVLDNIILPSITKETTVVYTKTDFNEFYIETTVDTSNKPVKNNESDKKEKVQTNKAHNNDENPPLDDNDDDSISNCLPKNKFYRDILEPLKKRVKELKKEPNIEKKQFLDQVLYRVATRLYYLERTYDWVYEQNCLKKNQKTL